MDGLPPGRVVAGSNADCAGRTGTLTLSIRFFVELPGDKHWRTVRVKTRKWHRLESNHWLEVSRPCAPERARAVFRWTLRDTTGAVVARKTVKSGALSVPGPDCRIVLV